MRSRPRAAFVVTVSMLGSVALAGCGKTTGGSGSGECKPPDCHINPPPPQPTPTPISMNPPAVSTNTAAPPTETADGGAKVDAGAKPSSSSLPRAK